MKTYFNRLQSGKKVTFLRVCQIITGKYAIETRNYKDRSFVVNVNLPMFDTQEQAEAYLADNYELEG